MLINEKELLYLVCSGGKRSIQTELRARKIASSQFSSTTAVVALGCGDLWYGC
jgi:hypothetical protein